ncbi:hypothetical protein [Marinobacterium lutimaris]|uniref:Uncharacterized protein n=1 Tax=Marinobacterium lutimaris TaxID=568106 RepID=A0A1H5YDG9_9GAMM|nr:hypothetical protein [Marinobacterium lutimaris]SEG21812.1 hypothetical protein SAMN05444390_1011707 [Marinobacterium lutimaris]
MSCEYVQKYYSVPACIGRRVEVSGRPGVIAQDCGHYIGVNFDTDKPGQISPCHPTWKVEYLGIGKVRKMTRSQQRYKRYLEYGDCFENFLDFCRWDAEPEHSWNRG